MTKTKVKTKRKAKVKKVTRKLKLFSAPKCNLCGKPRPKLAAKYGVYCKPCYEAMTGVGLSKGYTTNPVWLSGIAQRRNQK